MEKPVEYNVRPAAVQDVPAILQMIRELAAYEKLTHACVATEEGLAKHLFGPDPAAEALVVELACGGLAGYAIFFKTFSTFLALPGVYLEDLYVKPECRAQGMGSGMLRALAKLAVARGYGRVEWAVLDWNAPSIGFYKSLGAAAMEDWTTYRLAGEKLHAFAHKTKK